MIACFENCSNLDDNLNIHDSVSTVYVHVCKVIVYLLTNINRMGREI